jgi:hypothetical protein
MKKYSFLILALLIHTQSLFAGVSTNTRSKCHWYAKKYATNAHLSTSGCGYKWSWSHDGGCDWAESYVNKAWCCDYASEAFSHNGSSGRNTYLKTYCRTCGGIMSELYAALTAGGFVEDDLQPASQSSSFNPSFEEGTVVISDIKLQLQSDPSDHYVNTFTLAVWLPADDSTKGIEDTLYTAEKAIDAGTISLQYGRLSVTGSLFSAEDFSVELSDGLTTVNYVGGDKKVVLPKAISVDDVAVLGGGDVLPDEKSAFRLASEESVLKGSAVLTIAPNPVRDILNLNFTMPEANTLKILVYDAMGKLVLQQAKVAVAKGSNQLNLDMSQLASGTYYLMAEGAAVKILKQVVKL